MWKRYERHGNRCVIGLLRLEKWLFSKQDFVYRCYLPAVDFLRSLRSPGRLLLHRRLRRHLAGQNRSWPGLYTGGYFYQGLERIGISGVKPTEFRFRQYEVDALLDTNAVVLDVGSNCGFVAIHGAQRVDGVEINPYLNRIAADASAHLGVGNLRILEQDLEIVRYRMVECYLPPLDVDKLFIVARKAVTPGRTDFRLAQARTRYHY